MAVQVSFPPLCKDDIILSNTAMKQKRPFYSLLAILALAVLAAGLSRPSAESPQAQAFYYTPTPDADGRIMYVIKEGDTCISISLLNYVDLDTLQMLNNLNADCILIPGQKLLLGTVVAPTPGGPTATPTALLPSPTPFIGNGEVCIVLFNDINGNALAETGETAIGDGAISLSDRLGKVSLTGKTSASIEEPSCFSDLPEGEYNISVAVPEGYNPTTRMDYALSLKAGDRSTLDFGAQLSSQGQPETVAEGGSSPLLGILGGLVVLAGIGLGVYARAAARR
jgi:LysM repeat protein